MDENETMTGEQLPEAPETEQKENAAGFSENIEDTETPETAPPYEFFTVDAESDASKDEAASDGGKAKPAAAKRAAHKEKRAQSKRQRPARKRSKTVNRVLTVILTLLLIVLAVLVFVFRDELAGENLRKTFGRENSVNPAREAFTYETGAEQAFAAAGDGLAIASSSSVQLLDSKGQTVFKQAVSFDLPAVFACADRALFCDLGGTDCIVAGMDGESVTVAGAVGDDSHEILSAGMNGSGWFTLVTSEPGYKALVSVYNAACEKQYEWWSGTGYVLYAAVSPDNRSLAVLCADKEGTKLRFFALNSEEMQAELCFSDELLYDLYYMNSDTLCVIGDPGVYYVSADGRIKAQYPIGDNYLLDYTFDTNFITLFISDYHGGGGTLLTLDGKAGVLGTQTLERDVVSLSAQGKQLLVMTGGGLVLYDQALVRQYANETLMTAKQAVLRPNGDILLLYAYSAERFSF